MAALISPELSLSYVSAEHGLSFSHVGYMKFSVLCNFTLTREVVSYRLDTSVFLSSSMCSRHRRGERGGVGGREASRSEGQEEREEGETLHWHRSARRGGMKEKMLCIQLPLCL